MLDSKECFKCNLIKPLTEFYKHRMMFDGHLNKCKSCTRLDANNHRKENLDKIRSYDRERGKLPHRKALSISNTKHAREKITGYMQAHSLVARALKKGDLIKMPCCMCGSIMSVAHHDDYSKPLDIMWLCQVHHKARHAFLKYLDES